MTRRNGDWREVALEGWIWTRSLGARNQGGFNVAVNVPEGENLRLAPNGDRVGRAVEGALFIRTRRQGGWTLVRRRVWVRAAAFAAAAATTTSRAGAAAAPPQPAERSAQSVKPVDTTTPKSPPADSSAVSRRPADEGRTSTVGAAIREPVVVARGAELFAGPGAEVIGKLPIQLQAEVLERSSGWVKLRLDTWVREPDVAPAPIPRADMVTLDALRADPDRFVGRDVLWRLQYLSIQVADELRPEIPAGQTYLLTRGPLPEAGFVYVVVAREQVERFRGMQPLTEFVAQATILAPRTRYLPTPVIQLRRVP